MRDDGPAENAPMPKVAAKPTVARKKVATVAAPTPVVTDSDATLMETVSRSPVVAATVSEDAPLPTQNRLVANSPSLKAAGAPPALPADAFGEDAFGGGDAPSAAPGKLSRTAGCWFARVKHE
jgi:hypothetical protein